MTLKCWLLLVEASRPLSLMHQHSWCTLSNVLVFHVVRLASRRGLHTLSGWLLLSHCGHHHPYRSVSAWLLL